MSYRNFLCQSGDCNPFEYNGLFIFKDKDGENYTVVEVDNVQDSIGMREEPNEFAVYVEEFYIWAEDIREEKVKQRLLDSMGIPEEELGDNVELALVEEAVRMRDGVADRDEYGSRRINTFSEAARFVLQYDPESEELQNILSHYLKEDERETWIAWYIEEIVDGYLYAALELASNDDYGNRLPDHFQMDSFTKASKKLAEEDCRAFLNSLDFDDLVQAAAQQNLAQIGIDFWLTRNHHGAGFWDGDYEDELGARLTAASQMFPEATVWVSGNNRHIYIENIG
jgi:hypothetical protein